MDIGNCFVTHCGRFKGLFLKWCRTPRQFSFWYFSFAISSLSQVGITLIWTASRAWYKYMIISLFRRNCHIETFNSGDHSYVGRKTFFQKRRTPHLTEYFHRFRAGKLAWGAACSNMQFYTCAVTKLRLCRYGFADGHRCMASACWRVCRSSSSVVW